MSMSAMLMMAGTMGIVTIVTVYFFIQVMRAPPDCDD